MVFQLAKALSCLARRFTIGAVVSQPTDQGTHLFLSFTDGMFQALTSLFLMQCRLLLLLLPAQEQLFVQQLCTRQKRCSIFRGSLLSLALLLKALNHRIHFALSRRSQESLRLIKHPCIKP